MRKKVPLKCCVGKEKHSLCLTPQSLETPPSRKNRKQTVLGAFPGCWASACCYGANREALMGLVGSRFTAPPQTGLTGGHPSCLTLSLFSPASFFGDGYVEMPLADSSRTVRLQLRLYTSQGNGLLFLAAGQPDHLLLQLRASRLQVSTWCPPRVPGQGFSPCKGNGEAPGSRHRNGQLSCQELCSDKIPSCGDSVDVHHKGKEQEAPKHRFCFSCSLGWATNHIQTKAGEQANSWLEVSCCRPYVSGSSSSPSI